MITVAFRSLFGALGLGCLVAVGHAQSLTELGTAAGISADQAKISGVNGVKALQRVRKLTQVKGDGNAQPGEGAPSGGLPAAGQDGKPLSGGKPGLQPQPLTPEPPKAMWRLKGTVSGDHRPVALFEGTGGTFVVRAGQSLGPDLKVINIRGGRVYALVAGKKVILSPW